MSDWILRLIESKRAYRAKLAALPFEEKIKLLDQLRRRSLLLHSGRKRNLVETSEHQEFDGSTVLKAGLFQGVRSGHQTYNDSTFHRVRQNART